MLRTTHMNKLIFLVTALLMLIIVACSPTEPVADTANNSGGDNSSAIIVAPDKDVPSSEEAANDGAAATDYTGLPALPAMGNAGSAGVDQSMTNGAVAEAPVAAAPGMGMGGGGMADSLMGRGGGGGGYGYGGYYGSMPFVDTEFVLQTELPTEPAAANVWQSPSNVSLTVEQARQIAQQYGFSGELYLDYYSLNTPYLPEGDAGVEMYQSPTVYYAFDDTRMLTIYGTDVNLSNYTTMNSYGPMEYMPYEQALPIVETFLNEHGLLNFEYVARKNYWGQDVQIFRIVDGREVVNPDFTVTVTKDGVIAYLYQTRINDVSTATEYPLVTAAAAWELLQQGVDYSRIYYNIYPQLDEFGQPLPTQPVTTQMPTQPQYYPRQYQDGEAIELFPYLMGYLPAEGNGTPRIQGDQFRLLATDDVLQQLVGYIGQQIHVIGTIVQVAPNVNAIQITSWEPVTSYPEIRYEAGTLNWDETGQAVFTADAGLTWILPNAPTEIESGTRVFVNGWLPPGTATSAPQVFNWQTIEKMQTGIPGVEQITITKVDLVYSMNYGIPVLMDGQEQPTNLLQPAWRFTGTTNLGETIEIFVQAVDPSFISQP